MSQRPNPKPLPKPAPKPAPVPPKLPPRIPFPDDRGPVPPPRGPRGPADQPIPLPPRGGPRGPADKPLPLPPKTTPRPPDNTPYYDGSTPSFLNPDLIKKAKQEYLDSLPKDRAYSDIITNTKYGGTFGSSVGRGFDDWFAKNYINNPNSGLTQQERMTLSSGNSGNITEQQRRALQDYAIPNYQNQQFPIGNNLNDYGQIGRNQNIPIPQVAPTGNFGDTAIALQAQGKLPWQQGQVGQNTPFLQATDADQAALGSMGGFAPIQMSTQQNELRKRMLEQKLSQQENMYYAQPYFGPM